MSFWEGLTLLFIGLKFTDYIDYSWFIVLSPIGISIILGVVYNLFGEDNGK